MAAPDTFKRCPKCALNLPVTEFGPDKKTPSKLKSWCKGCNREANKKYYQANRQKIDAKNNAWRKHNKEKANSYNKNWRIKNFDKNNEIKKNWRKNNKEKISAQKANWRKNNKELVVLYSANRRARKKQNGIFVISKKDIGKLLTKPCFYCGGQSNCIDHIVPLSLGGTHSIGNIIQSCSMCNMSKGGKLLAEWKKSRVQ